MSLMYSAAPAAVRITILCLLLVQVCIGMGLITAQIFEKVSGWRAILAVAVSAGLYLLFDDLLLVHRGEGGIDLPVWLCLGIMGILLIQELHGAEANRRWMQRNITLRSIREAVEQIPTANCFVSEEGQVNLTNRKMTELIRKISGDYPRNGEVFERIFSGAEEGNRFRLLDREEDRLLLECSDGEAWELRRKRAWIDDLSYTEVQGTNVTEEVQVRKALQEKQGELLGMNRRLKEMNRSITRMTVERELLEAKIRIHDHLSRGLYAMEQYTEDPKSVDREQLLEEWRLHVRQLRMEGPETWQVSCEESLAAAEAMGVFCTVEGNLPESPRAREITAAAIGVHAANVRAHAGGDRARIVCSEDEGHYRLVFTNNGKLPGHVIREGGGFGNLRRMVEAAGGKMEIAASPVFEMRLELCKESEEEDLWQSGY